MKNIEINIDPVQIETRNEKTTEMDIEISEYDSQLAYLDIQEDLTDKTIAYIEREVRQSYEYRKYIDYLKTELDLTKCAMLPGIDCSNGAVSLEFHHYPLNLYEITEIVGRKMIDSLKPNEKVSCFQISEQVMKEHFLGHVGLIPLTKTMHEMAHNRAIIIPISKVNGNYRKFLNLYKDYIPNEINDRITEAENNSESDEAKIFNREKLEKNVIKYNISYNEDDGDGDEPLGGIYVK